MGVGRGILVVAPSSPRAVLSGRECLNYWNRDHGAGAVVRNQLRQFVGVCLFVRVFRGELMRRLMLRGWGNWGRQSSDVRRRDSKWGLIVLQCLIDGGL